MMSANLSLTVEVYRTQNLRTEKVEDGDFKVAKIKWASAEATGIARSPTMAIALALQNMADLLKKEVRDQAGIFYEQSLHVLDHICPVSQAQDESEAIRLCHHTNLQWLTASENRLKSDRPVPQALEKCRELLNREWV